MNDIQLEKLKPSITIVAIGLETMAWGSTTRPRYNRTQVIGYGVLPSWNTTANRSQLAGLQNCVEKVSLLMSTLSSESCWPD
jgi:hypothetical protein